MASPPGGSAGDDAVRLVLWRHGRTAWNSERRFQGQSDVPLDQTGQEQAERAARLVAALRPGAIFSSDLARAAVTAEALSRLTGLPVRLDKDLRERSGGCWEGLTDKEIRERYPAHHAAWNPPDGESFTAVADRMAEALLRIAGDIGEDSLAVVVSHGAAINLGISRLLGLPEQVRVLGPLGNCSWSLLSRRWGRWRLLEHNVGTLPEPVAEPEGGVDAEIVTGGGLPAG